MQSSRQSVLEESLYYKPSDKQVTQLLINIDQKPHDVKRYKQLLLQKEEFLKNNHIITGGFQKVNQILDPKLTRISFQDSTFSELTEVGGMCPICYQQIRGKGLGCNICKKIVCRNCLSRNRSMKNGFVAKFCDKCDQQFLEALVNKEFLKQMALYQKAFETLVREQEGLDILLKSQREKIKKQEMSVEKKKVLKNDERVQQLKYERDTQKQKNQEIQNKIDWGESMNKGLRVKYRKIKKFLKQSFGSVNSGSENPDWEAPKAEEYIQMDDDGINTSLITTNFQRSAEEEEVEGVHDKELCKCQLI